MFHILVCYLFYHSIWCEPSHEQIDNVMKNKMQSLNENWYKNTFSRETVLHWDMMVTAMSVTFFILTSIILHNAVDGEFNREIKVYDKVIREIQRYFINSNIVLFYAMDNPRKIFIWKVEWGKMVI